MAKNDQPINLYVHVLLTSRNHTDAIQEAHKIAAAVGSEVELRECGTTNMVCRVGVDGNIYCIHQNA